MPTARMRAVCDRKVRYRSPDTARRIAEVMTTFGFYGKRHSFYRCPCCEMWHLTTREGRDT